MPFLKTCLVLYIISCIFYSCSENVFSSVKYSIVIDLPLNQKAVYAKAVYAEENNTLVLSALRISSIIFTEKYISGDTIYLSAEVKEFIPEDFSSAGTKNGTIRLSISKKWISIEKRTEVSANFLYKSIVDTTGIPSADFNHDAIFPRVLKEGEINEIYRVGDGNNFSGYLKIFRAGREIKWDDIFGYNTGIYLETLSINNQQDTLQTSAIYDTHGLIVSQYSLYIIFTGTQNKIRVHNINRRIKDFSNPLFINELSFYADQVKKNNLTLIYR